MKKNKKQTESDFAFSVAQEVLEARLTKNLTQTQLAKKMATKQPAITRMEDGIGFPSLKLLFKMAKALGTVLIPPKFAFLEEIRNVSTQSNAHSETISIKSDLPTFGEYFSSYRTTTGTGIS